jgi:hypothetical protein
MFRRQERVKSGTIVGATGYFVMRDPETLASAIIDIEEIVSGYLEPGPRDANASLMAILQRLDRGEVPAAAERIRAGYGKLTVVS